MNLHEHVVKHKEATFFVTVQGDSMCGAHIMEGDILVVDRALVPKDGNIVIASVDGEFTVRRLSLHKNGTISLLSENPAYLPRALRDDQERSVFGVVTFVIHKC
jgi:DNA polymerase V